MAGIANIFFWQGHHKVARISTEWQPPGLDPNQVVSNVAYLFKFLFVYSYEVVTFDPCVCFSPFWYQNDEGGNVKQDILLVWPYPLRNCDGLASPQISPHQGQRERESTGDD